MQWFTRFKDNSDENFRVNPLSRLVILLLLIVVTFKVLVPMIENTINIQKYAQQSKRIQKTAPVEGTAISVTTVYTDIQPIPRVLPNVRLHGREVKMQVGDKLGSYRYTKASTWSKTQTVVTGNKYKIHIDPMIKGESEFNQGNLYTFKVFSIFIILDFSLLILLIYLLFFIVTIPQRWYNMSNTLRIFSVLPPISLILFMYLSAQYLVFLVN